jgi:hypothetical protein
MSRISLYSSPRSARRPASTVDLDWAECLNLLAARGWLADGRLCTVEHSALASRNMHPFWSPHELVAGGERVLADIVRLHLVVLEIGAPLEEVHVAYGHCLHIAYEGWDNTPDVPLTTMLLPLRRPISVAEHATIVQALAAHAFGLGLPVDPSSFDPAAIRPLPNVPDGAAWRWAFTTEPEASALDPDAAIGHPEVAEIGANVLLDSDAGLVRAARWTRAADATPRLVCACPLAPGAAPSTMVARRVPSGAVLFCLARNHAHRSQIMRIVARNERPRRRQPPPWEVELVDWVLGLAPGHTFVVDDAIHALGLTERRLKAKKNRITAIFRALGLTSKKRRYKGKEATPTWTTPASWPADDGVPHGLKWRAA